MLVGAVGRLSAEKGFDVLIHAADRLLSAGLDLEAGRRRGEGKERGRLEALIRDLGLRRPHAADRVIAPTPLPCYQAMDVFALSSLREGLPTSCLRRWPWKSQSWRRGLPASLGLSRHGENGLLVEPGSVEAVGRRPGCRS